MDAMKVAFLVPRRRDHGPRDLVWDYCRRRWQRFMPDVEVFEGHHDKGPFNRSRAVNLAAEAAGDWDIGIVIDSDILLSISQARRAIETAQRTGRVTWGHRRWRGVRQDATETIVADRHNHDLDMPAELDRDALDLIVERTNPLSWSCFIAMPRAVFDDMGGFDERFRGWGFEDMAFQSVIAGLYGHERIEGDVVHLWHPRSEERIKLGYTRDTATPEYVMNARLGRRYMVALRRDHKMHDRGDGPSSETERIRDIANLTRDDAKYTKVAEALGMPNWNGWWPTLPELVESAKAARGQEPAPTVTVVMRTGGESENWPERSAYLRQSLTSLASNVTGPVVQRVIYSDWDPEHRSELEQIAGEHGFYVVGPKRHIGYAQAHRLLWEYLSKRAQGDYIFSVEDDFTYDRPVDLVPMLDTLQANPHLRQVALLREAYYPKEIEAGGVLQSLATPTTLQNDRPHPFVEHRDHWTDNPSLFHVSICKTPWPTGKSTERQFGNRLLQDQVAAFAYFGSGESWITHIGEVRAGSAY
jgi:hypothetical protein